MDLTKNPPRSPNETMAGVVSLPRTIDKAKANDAGTLGDYDYDCPHDKPLFEFLGTDADEFSRNVRELESDERIRDWVQREKLSRKTPADVEGFNRDRRAWHPEPGSDSERFFNSEKARLGRPELTTWFELLDVDEGRDARRPQPAASARR